MRKHLKYTLLALAAMILLSAAIHFVAALTWDRHIHYTEISYGSPKITPELDGYVIAFIADTHQIPLDKLDEAVRGINAHKVDALLLGGDYDHHGPEPTLAVLSTARTTDGIFGVDGNHDDYETLAAAMQKYDMTLLGDASHTMRPGLVFAGARNAVTLKPNPVAALMAGIPKENFVVMLMHNPDYAMRQDTTGIDLILSGHTHGGQITLFGLWAPMLWPSNHITAYGQKFMHGWAKNNRGTDMFITRGLGTYLKTPRVFAPPEVVFVTLRAQP